LERSFSADPEIVIDHAREFIEAYRQHGILCAIKHFPGHGSSLADSHLGVSDVTKTWKEIELEPYKHFISEGMVDAIMTAHVFNRKWDPKYPATLSRLVINNWLRGKLGFQGVVFSDDIQMKAIIGKYGLETAIQRTITAGIDIITIGNNLGTFKPHIATEVTNIIKKLIKKGIIKPERIEESYQRILAFKNKLPH
jgi:beta-N-acetylhexosaminidase